MDKHGDFLPGVEVLTSLDELSVAQKDRLFEFLSNAVGSSTDTESGILDDQTLNAWGTKIIFAQNNSSEAIVGAALLLKPAIAEDILTISGLCYDKQFVVAGERILESAVSTREHDFANSALSIELANENEHIKRVAQELGFVCDQAGSDDSWLTFVLPAHSKIEPDSSSNDVIAEIDVGNYPELPPNVDQDHEKLNQFQCERCDKAFNRKSPLKKHTRY
eukprot:882642_1